MQKFYLSKLMIHTYRRIIINRQAQPIKGHA